MLIFIFFKHNPWFGEVPLIFYPYFFCDSFGKIAKLASYLVAMENLLHCQRFVEVEQSKGI